MERECRAVNPWTERVKGEEAVKDSGERVRMLMSGRTRVSLNAERGGRW